VYKLCGRDDEAASRATQALWGLEAKTTLEKLIVGYALWTSTEGTAALDQVVRENPGYDSE
jgi:hypothetical protein